MPQEASGNSVLMWKHSCNHELKNEWMNLFYASCRVYTDRGLTKDVRHTSRAAVLRKLRKFSFGRRM